MNIESPYLTKEEAATYLRVCPESIRRYVRRGWLKAGGTSGHLLFTKDQLDKIGKEGIHKNGRVD